jgi:AcrR family transcriptional regulator
MTDSKRPSRPGEARDTRAMLLAAARAEFAANGYHGTDTNRIARAAGLAPATFYRHFTDKADVFRVVYHEWVTEDWQRSQEVLAEGNGPQQTARRIVKTTLDFYREARGLRASLRALIYQEPTIRNAYIEEGRRQLGIVRERRAGRGLPELSVEEHFVVLCLAERVLDAVALDEGKELGLDEDRLLAVVERVLAGYIEGKPL